MKRAATIAFLLCVCGISLGQNFNVGITFQYHILKQVSVEGNTIFPTSSYNYYNIIDNNWKFFSAGQSIVIGVVGQLDYKRLYFAFEPSFELNTYDYVVSYSLSSNSAEKISFKTTMMQYDFPVYAGYQFGSSNLLRYSLFGGISVVVPFVINSALYNVNTDTKLTDRYGAYDMRDVLYTNEVYWNGLVGIGFHYASLFKVDIRYTRRLGSPGDVYKATFNTVGVGLTYYLPIRILKQKIYYEN